MSKEALGLVAMAAWTILCCAAVTAYTIRKYRATWPRERTRGAMLNLAFIVFVWLPALVGHATPRMPLIVLAGVPGLVVLVMMVRRALTAPTPNDKQS
jgi:hypothetical protein